jgi:hypothetical protein
MAGSSSTARERPDDRSQCFEFHLERGRHESAAVGGDHLLDLVTPGNDASSAPGLVLGDDHHEQALITMVYI